MTTPNKIKNTRVCTFEEDYNSKAGTAAKSEPIYRKGSTHAIHYKTVGKLQEKGAKMKVKAFDYEGHVAKAKKAFSDN